MTMVAGAVIVARRHNPYNDEPDSYGLTRDDIKDAVPFDIVADILRRNDDGCYVAPHCLSCPLPACIYDVNMGIQHRISVEQQIREMREAGETDIEVIMAATRRSRRTVYRLMHNMDLRDARDA